MKEKKIKIEKEQALEKFMEMIKQSWKRLTKEEIATAILSKIPHQNNAKEVLF